MLCRITDEPYYEPEDIIEAKTCLTDLDVHDLMGQDFEVYLKKNNKFGFDIEIDSADGEYKIRENGVHPYAVEAMADFCSQFLAFYNRAQIKSLDNEVCYGK